MNKVIGQLLFQGMWQNSLDSMFLIKVEHGEFYLVDINPVLARTVNVSRESISGLRINELLPDSGTVITRCRQCVEMQETIYYEEEGETPLEGKSYWHTMLVPLRYDGADYLLGASRNIGELKRTEQHLAQALTEAKAADAAKTLFLANMSHELRTPLNGIVGSASLLRRTFEQTPDTASQLDLIINSADAMNRLVEDILDLSKAANNSLRISRAPCRLTSALHEIATLVRNAAREKNLNYSVDIDPHIPRELVADETRVRQILLNLMSNAVKFTDQGSVRLQVNYCPTDQDSMAGKLNITVTDTGVGIPADHLADVGKPFFQVYPERNRRHTGSGIGLSVCRSLVELMEGTFAISSTLGQGTTVTVELPMRRIETAPQPAVKAEVALPMSFRVLVAEDNTANQMILRRMLEHIGVQVTLAGDGEAAVKIGTQEAFDLVLMDLQMPKMDGISAAQAMREAGLSVPIVAVTASVTERERSACRRAEMDDFIAKPVRLSALEALLARLFPAAA